MEVYRSFPITVIVRHPKERKTRCTVIQLKGRPDILIRNYPVRKRPPLEGYVRLCEDGPPLSEADKDCGILLLDSSWRRVEPMVTAFSDVPPRSLLGYQTAFPRASKLGTDPDNGLASIEALYIAYRILGRSTEGLFDHYRWSEEFLKANQLEESC
ncbi:MAG: hypothetical protein ACFCD0_28275 [Gemmataceae bacterium]